MATMNKGGKDRAPEAQIHREVKSRSGNDNEHEDDRPAHGPELSLKALVAHVASCRPVPVSVPRRRHPLIVPGPASQSRSALVSRTCPPVSAFQIQVRGTVFGRPREASILASGRYQLVTGMSLTTGTMSGRPADDTEASALPMSAAVDCLGAPLVYCGDGYRAPSARCVLCRKGWALEA